MTTTTLESVLAATTSPKSTPRTHWTAKANERLEAYIEHTKSRAASAVSKIMSSAITDRIAPATSLRFVPTANGVGVELPGKDGETVTDGIHVHALDQLGDRFGVGQKYASTLLTRKSEWSNQLLAHSYSEIAAHAEEKQRFLVRSIDGEVRGVLSDAYRRMDTRPIADAFIGAAQRNGAMICDGTAADTRISLKAVLPEIFTANGDPFVVGVDYSNSDFGDGTLQVRGFVLRLACFNGAVREVAMKKVHIGARLGQDMSYSQKTYELDTRTLASATEDVLARMLDATAVKLEVARIEEAAGRTIDADSELKKMMRLTPVERTQAAERFRSADIELLPAGNSAWRLSNAVSFLARESEDARRRLELEVIAGELLTAGEKRTQKVLVVDQVLAR